MRLARYAFILILPILAACGTTPEDNRRNLAKTEISATAAYQEAGTLAKSGVIKPGSPTALAIADMELAVQAIIRTWRRDPEDPQYAAAGIAALPALLGAISKAKGGK